MSGGAELGVTAAAEDIVTFDEIFDLYYSLKSPYRRSRSVCLQRDPAPADDELKDKNDNYIWKPLWMWPSRHHPGPPDPHHSFMPALPRARRFAVRRPQEYWVADRQNRTFRRLNELYARTDQGGFLTTQRVDGRLILPESVKVLKMSGTKVTSIRSGRRAQR